MRRALGLIALYLFALGIVVAFGEPGHGLAINVTRAGNVVMGIVIGYWHCQR